MTRVKCLHQNLYGNIHLSDLNSSIVIFEKRCLVIFQPFLWAEWQLFCLERGQCQQQQRQQQRQQFCAMRKAKGKSYE